MSHQYPIVGDTNVWNISNTGKLKQKTEQLKIFGCMHPSQTTHKNVCHED